MAQTNYFDLPPLDVSETSGRRMRKKRATAHRIFRSAIELMQKDGFDGVTIEQICERADVARATFFQHFSSKAALMSAFSDIVRYRIEDELAQEALSPTEQLHLIVDHLQRLAKELGPIAPDMLSAFTTEPGGGFHVDDPETGLTQLIVGIVKQGQTDGTYSRQLSAEDIAISVISAMVSVLRRHVSSVSSSEDGPLHGVLEFILDGLKTR